MTIVDKTMPRLLTRTEDDQPLMLVAGAMRLVGYLPHYSVEGLSEEGSIETRVWSEQIEDDDIPLYTPAPRFNFASDDPARRMAALMVENDILREALRGIELDARSWISDPLLGRDHLLGRLALTLLQIETALRDHSKAHLLVGTAVPDEEESGV